VRDAKETVHGHFAVHDGVLADQEGLVFDNNQVGDIHPGGGDHIAPCGDSLGPDMGSENQLSLVGVEGILKKNSLLLSRALEY
jgi:hypothetical protein